MRWRGFRKVRRQVCRRIRRRLGELQLEGFGEYRRYLESSPSEWRILDGCCRVTISRFFRDRGVFEALGSTVLPSLAATIDSGGVVSVWSAGCGSGEEPYTVSLVWEKRVSGAFPEVGIRIVATDAEPVVLRRAAEARYEEGTLRDLPPKWVDSAFRPASGGEEGEGLVLLERIRTSVEFRHEDVREGMPDGPFHLILCRNLVFTYFDQSTQVRLLQRIIERLVPGGYLVLGAHEEIPDGRWPLSLAAGSRCVLRYSLPPSGTSCSTGASGASTSR